MIKFDAVNLVIFDIDGTLTETNAIDSEAFSRAISEYLKINNLNTDWNSYRYSTDSGLLLEIFDRYLQRMPCEEEIQLIQDDFFIGLENRFTNNPSLCTPILGANSIFTYIESLGNWHIAIATGGWKRSALLKLKTAEIEHSFIPKAFSDDHVDRTEIIKVAIQRAMIFHNVRKYSRIIYVGDRLWDKTAAESLEIEFIGIGNTLFSPDTNFISNYSESNLIKFKNILL